MVNRYTNICRMCLKDNCNNEFVSLQGNRDLKLKFFYCFSIAFADSTDQHLLCAHCIEQLNNFYQLKNHVARAHNIFFGLQPQPRLQTPVQLQQPQSTQGIAHFDPVKTSTLVELPTRGAPSTSGHVNYRNHSTELDIAEALQKISKTPSSIRSRSIQVHSASDDPSTALPFVESIDDMSPKSNTAPLQSYNIVELVKVKKERDHTEQVPLLKRRGKQRGEVGRSIFQDPITQRFPCVLCSKTFSSYNSIYMHIRNVHMNIVSCICDFCGKGFNAKSTLQAHIFTAHKMPFGPTNQFQCMICLKVMKTKAAWTIHRMYKHLRKNSI